MKSPTKQINGFTHIRYQQEFIDSNSVENRSEEWFNFMNARRSIRTFSSQLIPKEIIQNLIKTGSTAPSGAHKQPWHFCAVSNTAIKKSIRKAAEKEEKESYNGRMSERWINDLKALDTDWQKPYLEIAPWLIIVFKKSYDFDQEGNKVNNYYVNESVGLAAGFLINAIHQAGLVALTHTPSPMNFLTSILNRPSNEKPVLLIPVGYPAKDVYVPDLKRKELDEVGSFYE